MDPTTRLDAVERTPHSTLPLIAFTLLTSLTKLPRLQAPAMTSPSRMENPLPENGCNLLFLVVFCAQSACWAREADVMARLETPPSSPSSVLLTLLVLTSRSLRTTAPLLLRSLSALIISSWPPSTSLLLATMPLLASTLPTSRVLPIEWSNSASSKPRAVLPVMIILKKSTKTTGLNKLPSSVPMVSVFLVCAVPLLTRTPSRLVASLVRNL
mmetsp:Transcript_19658/g.42722  ORF Transcript_19658/g.42722 Transcript_19658/m.42722 type:complete len:213 (+) Transcript_19658:1440-2078(+)